jgi:predicted nucleic acid-binding protein
MSETFVILDSSALIAQTNKRPSFVDCLVMATADFYDTREIFGFDAVFAKNGYSLPGTEEQQAA